MPIEVADWNDLDAVRQDTDADYELINNLDSSTEGYDEVAGPDANGEEGWEPIGGSGDGFDGLLDGRGFEIADLVMDRPDADRQALFDRVVDGEVRDLSLVGFDITGDSRCAGIAASCEGDMLIDNCHVAGGVDCSENAGGLVGDMDPGTDGFGVMVTGCSVDVDITASEGGAGGFFGISFGNNDGTIVENCVAEGTIHGSGGSTYGGAVGSNQRMWFRNCVSFVDIDLDSADGAGGGFVGEKFDGGFEDCYSLGDVILPEGDTVGGFAGASDDDDSGSLDDEDDVTRRCYTAHETVDGESTVGGWGGQGAGSFGDLIPLESYWDGERSNQSDPAGDPDEFDGDGLTELDTDDMQGSAPETTMDAFDFDDTWMVLESGDTFESGTTEITLNEDGYPILSDVDAETQIKGQDVDIEVSEISATIEDTDFPDMITGDDEYKGVVTVENPEDEELTFTIELEIPDLDRQDSQDITLGPEESGEVTLNGGGFDDSTVGTFTAQVVSGDNTEDLSFDVPAEVSDWQELDAIRDSPNDPYILTESLDEDSDWYAAFGSDFTPITSFGGSFYGSGHSISDLVIDTTDRTEDTPCGFFETWDTDRDVTVKNVDILDAVVRNETDTTTFSSTPEVGTGILVGTPWDDGFADDSKRTIENCTFTGQVEGVLCGGITSSFVSDDESSITNCVVDVDIESTEGCGGVAFRASSGDQIYENILVNSDLTVSDSGFRCGGFVARGGGNTKNVACFTNINIQTDVNDVGGLIADHGSSATVDNCYAYGSISGTADDIGGLVGNDDNEFGDNTIENCYAAVGLENADAPNLGGVIGRIEDETTITVSDAYWDEERSGISTDASDDSVSLTTAEMQGSESESNMDGFDFEGVWDSVSESADDTTGDGYPILSGLSRRDQLEGQSIFNIASLDFTVWRSFSDDTILKTL